ncbi:Sporulation related domain-containing protein [Xaviernesmea oryzae]|uniref:Sporulation related domain-containing protein n=1 Tax=Xaviernesmea oryzae TaxID=464029 RepID=A0A1X7G9D6_9HYPH|nr:SPOR domain-containing protein [Xaviernesmea oryzae]SMF66306.1 Sporulation related domain-containing protein [Xaviernesmea oryzae]
MADNNLARSRNDLPVFFADDDPLAELARIVGYEDRPVATPAAPLGAAAPEPRREPALNLEDELLREFERYDAPRLDPVHDITLDEAPQAPVEAAPSAPAQPIEPEELDFIPAEASAVELPAFLPSDREAFVHGDLDFGDEEAPAAFDAAVESVRIEAEPAQAQAEPIQDEPAVELAQETGHVDPIVDLPDLPVMGEISAVPQASFSQPSEQSAQEFDLAAELESSIGAEPAIEGQPEVKPEPKGKGYVPGFRMPLANFAPASASVPQQEPIVPEPAGQVFDLPVLDDLPALTSKPDFIAEVPASVPAAPADLQAAASAAPVAPPAAVEPVPAENRFSALDELIYDVQRYAMSADKAGSPAAAFSKTPEPAPSEPLVTAAAEPVVPVAQAPAPEAPAAKAQAVEEKDPFSDEEFELALGDLELDLADLVAEEAPKQPEEAAPATAPAAKIETAPAKPAMPVVPPAPVVAAAPAVMAAAEAKDDVEAVAELPFDPAQIADSEDQVEAIAELDVPALPAEEPEQPPVYRPDYDLDIDAELATLLMTPEKAADSAPARKPEIAIASAAQGAADRPVQAGRTPNYTDLDDFERALEEDFRRSLAAPLPPSENEDLHYAEADYLATVEKARSSARSWAVPVVLAGVVILGGVGAYAWLGNGVPGVGSGEPVIIAADTEPVKVAPENPGGKTVPNQDKAVYDRVAGLSSQDPKQEMLISSNEEPVDVVQKTLMPDTLPLEGENDIEPTDVGETADARLLPQDQPEQAAASAEQQPVTVMPRKVKTMIVRPDGTLVEQEVSAPALAAPEPAKVPASGAKLAEVAAASPQAPVSAPAAPAQTQPVQPAPSAGAAPVSAPATGSEPFDPVAPEIALPPVETAAAPAAPAEAAAPAPAVRAPVPIARPSEQPVNVVAAVTDQGNVRASNQPAAPSPQPAATQTASLGEGGYVIQIASLPSEADARKSYQNLSTKFGSVIGGRGVDIKAAEIAGKGTFYRVRIPAGSKNDAVALCERYRAAGGSCLVAR